jgi:hypothetical protein
MFVEQLALQGGEEALGHSVVVGVTDGAHGKAQLSGLLRSSAEEPQELRKPTLYPLSYGGVRGTRARSPGTANDEPQATGRIDEGCLPWPAIACPSSFALRR